MAIVMRMAWIYMHAQCGTARAPQTAVTYWVVRAWTRERGNFSSPRAAAAATVKTALAPHAVLSTSVTLCAGGASVVTVPLTTEEFAKRAYLAVLDPSRNPLKVNDPSNPPPALAVHRAVPRAHGAGTQILEPPRNIEPRDESSSELRMPRPRGA